MTRDKGVNPVVLDWIIDQMIDAFRTGRRRLLVPVLIVNGAQRGFSEYDIRRALQSILMESRDVPLEQYGREMTGLERGFGAPTAEPTASTYAR